MKLSLSPFLFLDRLDDCSSGDFVDDGIMERTLDCRLDLVVFVIGRLKIWLGLKEKGK